MQVVVENSGPCRKTLRIQIPVEKVKEEYQGVLQSYSKSAPIPGFRRGHAPAKIVDRRFGKEIRQEVKDRLIPLGYREAIQREKIDTVAVLGVGDVQFGVDQPLSFSVTLDVPPEFGLPSLDKINLQAQAVEVKPEQVEQVLTEIRDRNARYEDVTGRAVQEGDLVCVDFEGICEGRPVSELAPSAAGLGSSKDFWVHAGEHAFLPGFDKGLLGASLGEKRQVQVDFPPDFAEKSLAGRKATYFVDVKGVRMLLVQDLTDEFIKSLGAESKDELQERIRKDLQALAEEREKGRQKSELIKQLLDLTTMELPESVVDEETRHNIYDLVRQSSARGVSRDDIEANKEQLYENANRSARDKVKARYILHRIAREKALKVAPADLDQRIASLAARNGVEPEQMKAYLHGRHMLEDLEDQVLIEKTLDVLLGEVKIKPA